MLGRKAHEHDSVATLPPEPASAGTAPGAAQSLDPAYRPGPSV